MKERRKCDLITPDPTAEDFAGESAGDIAPAEVVAPAAQRADSLWEAANSYIPDFAGRIAGIASSSNRLAA